MNPMPRLNLVVASRANLFPKTAHWLALRVFFQSFVLGVPCSA